VCHKKRRVQVLKEQISTLLLLLLVVVAAAVVVVVVVVVVLQRHKQVHATHPPDASSSVAGSTVPSQLTMSMQYL
jgi:preprotein translocase subunit SecG